MQRFRLYRSDFTERIIKWSKFRWTDTTTWNKFPAEIWVSFDIFISISDRMEIPKILECTSLKVFFIKVFLAYSWKWVEWNEKKAQHAYNAFIHSFVRSFELSCLHSLHAEPDLLALTERVSEWVSEWLTLNATVIYLFAVCTLETPPFVQCRFLHMQIINQ